MTIRSKCIVIVSVLCLILLIASAESDEETEEDKTVEDDMEEVEEEVSIERAFLAVHKKVLEDKAQLGKVVQIELTIHNSGSK